MEWARSTGYWTEQGNPGWSDCPSLEGFPRTAACSLDEDGSPCRWRRFRLHSIRRWEHRLASCRCLSSWPRQWPCTGLSEHPRLKPHCRRPPHKLVRIASTGRSPAPGATSRVCSRLAAPKAGMRRKACPGWPGCPVRGELVRSTHSARGQALSGIPGSPAQAGYDRPGSLRKVSTQ